MGGFKHVQDIFRSTHIAVPDHRDPDVFLDNTDQLPIRSPFKTLGAGSRVQRQRGSTAVLNGASDLHSVDMSLIPA